MSTTTEMTPFAADPRGVAAYLGLNPNDPKSHAVVAVCERYGFDPLLKHVVIIPGAGAYITRDGLLHTAHQSGQFDGLVVEDQGWDPEAKEWWAVVSVHRKDMRFPFKFRGRYSGSNRKYGPEMAVKCAAAMALRHAFDVTGLPTQDEFEAHPRAHAIVTSHLMPPPITPDTEADPEPDWETADVVEGEVAE
jgi:hypothetical protein